MLKRLIFVSILLLAGRAHGETCPGADDEPAMKVKTAAGPVVVVCGFEDREETVKGKKTFTDFTVYGWPAGAKEPAKVFAADPIDTYWARVVEDKGLELEEVWFFADKPQAALTRQVTCTPAACEVSVATCVLKLKKNPHPKALASFQKKIPHGDVAENLLEDIWAQALTGDKNAQDFFATAPKGLSAELTEDFNTFKAKLQQAKDLNCPSLK
ncbi:MAG: hypothetical protein KF799_01330 [Bdellovibrionales bacterium]|nr:hypothetical protein [Bdellovibrionales bacterium]